MNGLPAVRVQGVAFVTGWLASAPPAQRKAARLEGLALWASIRGIELPAGADHKPVRLDVAARTWSSSGTEALRRLVALVEGLATRSEELEAELADVRAVLALLQPRPAAPARKAS